MGKLDAEQIEEYFSKHLPYRTGILLAHYKMAADGWTGDPAWLNACFISSLVTGRLYLNVLGIRKSKKSGELARFVSQPDDVTVEDLGGKLLDPTALPAADSELFRNFLTMADKAAAHFTLPMNHDWARTHDVIRRIHHYLKVNLYDPAGRSGLEPLT